MCLGCALCFCHALSLEGTVMNANLIEENQASNVQ